MEWKQKKEQTVRKIIKIIDNNLKTIYTNVESTDRDNVSVINAKFPSCSFTLSY